MKKTIFLLSMFINVISFAGETASDLILNSDKYVGKKVNLVGAIYKSQSPLSSPSDNGKYYTMMTYKYVRGSTGKNELSEDVNNYVMVFVQNDKINSFCASYKDNEKPKSISGTFTEFDPKDEEEIKKVNSKTQIYVHFPKYYINTAK